MIKYISLIYLVIGFLDLIPANAQTPPPVGRPARVLEVEKMLNREAMDFLRARFPGRPFIVNVSVDPLLRLKKGERSDGLPYYDLADEEKLSKDQLIRSYLDMCRFHPVSFGEGSATNPEQGKINAMEEFVSYVRNLSHSLQQKAFMKNKISNYFTPFIGFSDDDVRNVETMKKHFDKKEDNILKTYLTAGGQKKLY